MKKIKIFAFIAILTILGAFVATDMTFSKVSAMELMSAVSLSIAPMAISRIPKLNANDIERVRAQGVYTGEGDVDLEFADGHAQSFIDEHLNTREFNIKIVNGNASEKKILLFPGYFDTLGFSTGTVTVGETEYTFITGINYHNIANVVARGFSVDAMVGDGTVGTNITCSTGSKGSIKDFINFIRNNPTRIPEIVVASNNTAQYNKKMVVKRIHPGKDWGEDYISLQRSLDVNQNRDEKIIVNTAQHNLQLDDQTLIYIEVEGKAGDVDTILDLTLKLGGSINNASGLYRRAISALGGIRNFIMGR